MKKAEFIDLLKEYLNFEVRKIIREEIELALGKKSIAIKEEKIPFNIPGPTKNSPPLEHKRLSNPVSPKPTGISPIQNILAETYKDMMKNGPVPTDDDELMEIGDQIPGFNFTTESLVSLDAPASFLEER